jgi:hypothetical protein
MVPSFVEVILAEVPRQEEILVLLRGVFLED